MLITKSYGEDALTNLERLLVSSMLLVEEEALRKVQQPRSSKMTDTLSYIPRGDSHAVMKMNKQIMCYTFWG